jgi:hypothetical protein
MRRTMSAAVIISATVVACGGAIESVPPVPSDGSCGPNARCPAVEPPSSDPSPGDPGEPAVSQQPTASPKPGAPKDGQLPGESWSGWKKLAFTYDRAQTACAGGERFVRKSERYRKWVGVELCSATRYKIFLGESVEGTFHEIGDFAGHGQDHCELVSPTFTMPNEDEITAACPSCDVEMAGWQRPGAVPVYSRAVFGEAFELQTWPEHNLYTSSWYECGVAISE